MGIHTLGFYEGRTEKMTISRSRYQSVRNSIEQSPIPGRLVWPRLNSADECLAPSIETLRPIVGLMLPANKSVCEGVVNQVSASLQPKFLVNSLAIRLHGFLA